MTPEPAAEPDDAGFSLSEVMITMAIMSVLMVLVTGALIQVYRTTSATETLSDAQSELSRAFQRFDRELRYASWVATPGTVGTGATAATYVEFAGPDETDCYQLRLQPGPSGTTDQGVLQLLTWKAGRPPAKGTPGNTVASQVVTGGADPYFELQAPGSAPYASAPVGTTYKAVNQRLRIRLTTSTGEGTASIDTTFTALNTTDTTPATNACSEGRPR